MTDPTAADAAHQFRSGTAARLAGLPVTTLRVWERRYDVVAARKTATGQRVYTPHDVARLRLLRQLTRAGHAIGTIAALELEALRSLAAGESAAANAAAHAAANAAALAEAEVVVVGRPAARTLQAVPGCVVRAVYDDLEHAETATATETAEASAPRTAGGALLLVRLASLQPSAVERVLALGARLGARAIFAIYGFGTRVSIRSLREAGATVRREPLAEGELAQWVRAVREAPAPVPARARPEAGWVVAPRVFGDETLARLAALPSPVACECLRHMAEIVSQLAGFERYSQDCVSTGPADAALHRHLSRTAGAARTMFEQALQQVVNDERLELPDGTA